MGIHFLAIAILHFINGLATLGVAALFGLGALGFGFGIGAEDLAGGIFVGVMGFVLTAFVALWALVEFACGMGILGRKGWARGLAIVLAVFYLPGFPIGSAIGAWTLWALLSEKGAREYKAGI